MIASSHPECEGGVAGGRETLESAEVDLKSPATHPTPERSLLLEIAGEMGTPEHIRVRVRAALNLETPSEIATRRALEVRARCIAAARGLIAIDADHARALLEMSWLQDASPEARAAWRHLEAMTAQRGAALIGEDL